MAPMCPEEVDVFTIPHSRMKELVYRYLDMLTCTNFSNVHHMTILLENLIKTFREFIAHEQIENRYIMKKLKHKLQQLSIQNTAVCNCHKDNQLLDMLSLLEDGYRCTKKSDADRINYGIQLRGALETFTDAFLPHMAEEEEVFQPLLMQHFTVEELKQIKATVIQQHFKIEEDVVAKEDSYLDDEPEKFVHDNRSEPLSVPKPPTGFNSVPDEVMLKIFSHLDPRDRCRSAQVSHRWNRLALDGSLWSNLYPVSWAKGDWNARTGVYEEDSQDLTEKLEGKRYDEDADVDEAEDWDSEAHEIQYQSRMLSCICKHLLPRVGPSVKLCDLAYSKGITNGSLYKILSQCPNLEYLSLVQTRVSDLGFKGLQKDGCGPRLRHLDLSGCLYITDTTLHRLSAAMGQLPCHMTQTDDHVTQQNCLVDQETGHVIQLNKHTAKEDGTTTADREYTVTQQDHDMADNSMEQKAYDVIAGSAGKENDDKLDIETTVKIATTLTPEIAKTSCKTDMKEPSVQCLVRTINTDKTSSCSSKVKVMRSSCCGGGCCKNTFRQQGMSAHQTSINGKPETFSTRGCVNQCTGETVKSPNIEIRGTTQGDFAGGCGHSDQVAINEKAMTIARPECAGHSSEHTVSALYTKRNRVDTGCCGGKPGLKADKEQTKAKQAIIHDEKEIVAESSTKCCQDNINPNLIGPCGGDSRSSPDLRCHTDIQPLEDRVGCECGSETSTDPCHTNTNGEQTSDQIDGESGTLVGQEIALPPNSPELNTITSKVGLNSADPPVISDFFCSNPFVEIVDQNNRYNRDVVPGYTDLPELIVLPGSSDLDINLEVTEVKSCDTDFLCEKETLPAEIDGRYLKFLSLSGCYQITDDGIQSLTDNGGLPHLTHLDLSGCLHLGGDALCDLVSTATKLEPSSLYYCDNVLDGPHPAEASGCQNLQCDTRVCCRGGE